MVGWLSKCVCVRIVTIRWRAQKIRMNFYFFSSGLFDMIGSMFRSTQGCSKIFQIVYLNRRLDVADQLQCFYLIILILLLVCTRPLHVLPHLCFLPYVSQCFFFFYFLDSTLDRMLPISTSFSLL